MVYDVATTAVAMLHIGAGAAYFGSTLLGGVMMSTVVKRLTTIGEWNAYYKLFRPISQFDGAAATVAFLSGFLFLALRYPPFDLGAYAGIPNTRPILVALGLFGVLFVFQFTVASPIEKRLRALKLPEDPTARAPPELMDLVGRFGRTIAFQEAVIVLIVGMMVLAANGGF